MEFLHKTFDNEIVDEMINNEDIPFYLSDNLKHPLRPYQEKAFRRFIYFYNKNGKWKQRLPYHLLYNMATGSGKTLIMAGLILELYEKGYRNFIFFVNSTNIIKKTKDNFLNPHSTKYLFKDKITFDGKEVLIKEVENFDESDERNINIKFTTIQQLHYDLDSKNTKENSLTIEDFKNKKIVLIADEAHHLSATTKNSTKNFFGSWEGTVLKLFEQNLDNILLEFTATIDYNSRDIVEKYRDKVLFRYDLKEYRNDKYSKEINIIRSYYDEQERIIQALILNLYRQELAVSNGINLKPVILFKAKKTIDESKANKEKFHKLIDELSEQHLEDIKKTSTVSIVQQAFYFFETKNISLNEMVKRLQNSFIPEFCLCANEEKEIERNQILLNTLEDSNNPIRAIFAVHKLNEGWDVLNLFDIVRLYESRDVINNRPGKTTVSEAQLLGRGARYFPFTLDDGQDKYTRKFDDDISNDLKILEELYYHTKEDSRYISELKQALIETGILIDDLETKKLALKEGFKKSDFYKKGHIILNKKIPRDKNKTIHFSELSVCKKDFSHTLSFGLGHTVSALEEKKDFNPKVITANVYLKNRSINKDDVKVIPEHIIRFALSCNPFFRFDNFRKYYSINSLSDFIRSENYLGGLKMKFSGTKERIDNIENIDYLQALNGLLQTIEIEIKNNFSEFEGSEFCFEDRIRNVFRDKEVRVRKDVFADWQEKFLEDKDWYVYNANYGTSEEKKFVEMFANKFALLENKYENIYLIRNERMVKIYDKIGRGFEPDFILFCKEKNKRHLTYQVFIEPKGKHLIEHDRWKQEFLEEIRKKEQTIEIALDTYLVTLVTAVPFYNNENEKEFEAKLLSVLEI